MKKSPEDTMSFPSSKQPPQSSLPVSRPRPIHGPGRSLTNTPDPMEPQNSYNDTNESFLNDEFMEAELAYHQDSPVQRPQARRVPESVGGGLRQTSDKPNYQSLRIIEQSRSVEDVVDHRLAEDPFLLPPSAQQSARAQSRKSQYPNHRARLSDSNLHHSGKGGRDRGGGKGPHHRKSNSADTESGEVFSGGLLGKELSRYAASAPPGSGMVRPPTPNSDQNSSNNKRKPSLDGTRQRHLRQEHRSNSMPAVGFGAPYVSSSSSNLSAAAKAKSREKEFSRKMTQARKAKREAQSGAVEFGHIGGDEEEEDELRALGDAASGMMLLHHLTPARYDGDSSMGTTGTSVDGGGVTGDALFAMDVTDGGSRRALQAQHAAAAVENDDRDRAVNQLLDRTGRIHCKQRKKLILANLDLSARDIPVDVICSKPLGDSLHKLSLAQNHLVAVPDRLVLELSGLHTLNLSQCDLTSLPPMWRLGSLRRLNLSHNRLEDFLDEVMLKGLPELKHLDMYDNKLCEVILPRKGLLAKLEFLNLGFNNLVRLPEDLPQLKRLRVLKVTNNLITHIPKRVVCDMDLKELEVTPNPLIQPPIEDCERGICGMRRYYRCLAMRGPCGREALSESRPTPIKSIRKTVNRLSGLRSKGRKDSASSDDTSPTSPTAIQTKKLMKAVRSGIRSISTSTAATQESHGPSSPPPSVSKSVPSAMRKSPERRRLTASTPAHAGTSAEAQLAIGAAPVVPSLHGEERSSAEIGHLESTSETVTDEASLATTFDLSEAPSAADQIDDTELGQTLRDGPRERSAKLIQRTSDAFRKVKLHDKLSASPTVLAADEGRVATPPHMVDDVVVEDIAVSVSGSKTQSICPEDFVVNDTLKIIFVGMAYAGKTSMIRRLKHGGNGTMPKRDQRTIGVDIYEWDPNDAQEWDPKGDLARETKVDGGVLETRVHHDVGVEAGEVDIKFSMWDFAGQTTYHATHELFFSPRALYVLVWDMAANNRELRRSSTSMDEENAGAFGLPNYDSSDEEQDDDIFASENDTRRFERALERDIDDKVQFWVDCIQSSVPGAAILPVATFDDHFDEGKEGGLDEARRRCNLMKKRLLQHEERRKAGLQRRYELLKKSRRANTEAALRLRKLLCPFSRPKILFGTDGGKDGDVLRVSCTANRGFDRLREKIVNISTGRDLMGCPYPIFQGHVGAVIPRMRLEVRDVVRKKRERQPVVEWGHLLTILNKSLREEDVKNVDDVSDALHFLSNIGELSYFGGVASGKEVHTMSHDDEDEEEEEEEDEEAEKRILAIDDCGNDPYLYVEENKDDEMECHQTDLQNNKQSSGLSEFVFLNPRWLVAVVACILRHDLRLEIDETKRRLASRNDFEVPGDWQSSGRGGDFHAISVSCPIITAGEACMLWSAKKVILKAAELAKDESSSATTLTAFEFLQRLLVRFSIFVPIDLNIDKALFGGEEYGIDESPCNIQDGELSVEEIPSVENAKYFFLPSLLGPKEPSDDTWTYKCSESWRKTLCVSWTFPDGVPPGLMERVTASVLRDIYALTQHENPSNRSSLVEPEFESLRSQIGDSVGLLRVHEILCWRTAFLLKFGMEVVSASNGERRESIVEIFAHLVDQHSPLCVAADSMSIGMRKLVVSGKGQIGDGGRKIWKGGYEMVTKAVERVIREYGGLEYEKEGVCPECLATLNVSQAGIWNWTKVRYAAMRGLDKMRCPMGHDVDTRLVGGFRSNIKASELIPGPEPSVAKVAAKDILGGVVLVGLWDAREGKIIRAGSGFVVDKKRGLIVTASHTLMDMTPRSSDFGIDYYGRYGKAVIGVVPRNGDGQFDPLRTPAVFRYFAEIVAKDPQNMDACVLKIKTRLEKDVGGEGSACAEQPERPLFSSKEIKREGLQELKVTETFEMEERVRLLGFNQGGGGLVSPGSHLNRVADYAEGYVNTYFQVGSARNLNRNELQPRGEIVVMSPTIGGHSGGPCVNQAGEVIGILSRADPADRQRCYLVPACEFSALVDKAKRPLHPMNEFNPVNEFL